MSLLLLLLGVLGMSVVALGIALGSVLWRAIGKLVSNELEAVVPELADGLLKKAIQRLPVEYRDRLAEEWSAGLRDSLGERPLLALAQAASLYKEARRIAAELEPSTVPAGGAEERDRTASRFGGVGRALKSARVPRRSERARMYTERIRGFCLWLLGLPRDGSPAEWGGIWIRRLGSLEGLFLLGVGLYFALYWLGLI